MPKAGRPLVVNLWATWCAPCRDEMPVLAQAQADNSHIDLVLVNQKESAAVVQAYLEQLGLRSARSLLDPDGALASTVGVVGYPTTLFYDGQGRLLEKHSGKFSRATFAEKLRRLYPAAMDAKS
jgi:YD repeat-containing protein